MDTNCASRQVYSSGAKQAKQAAVHLPAITAPRPASRSVTSPALPLRRSRGRRAPHLQPRRREGRGSTALPTPAPTSADAGHPHSPSANRTKPLFEHSTGNQIRFTSHQQSASERTSLEGGEKTTASQAGAYTNALSGCLLRPCARAASSARSDARSPPARRPRHAGHGARLSPEQRLPLAGSRSARLPNAARISGGWFSPREQSQPEIQLKINGLGQMQNCSIFATVLCLLLRLLLHRWKSSTVCSLIRLRTHITP